MEDERSDFVVMRSKKNPIAFLFPGQGSQYVGMGETLFRHEPEARRVYEEAGDILGYSLHQVSFGGTKERLAQTEITQPAVLTASVAAFRALRMYSEVEPSFLAGHSMGEFSALACADVLSFADALRLTQLRGQLMQEAAHSKDGGMMAVMNVELAVLEMLCLQFSKGQGHEAVVANLNSPSQIVISGHNDVLEQIAERVTELGGSVVMLTVSAPFHSPAMAEVGAVFRSALVEITFSPPRYPVISNVTARPHGEEKLLKELLVRQISEPVRWHESMRYLRSQGVTLAIEMGPGSVLSRLAGSIYPGLRVFSLDEQGKTPDFDCLGKQLNEEADLSIVRQCIRSAVAMKNYSFTNNRGELDDLSDLYTSLRKLLASGTHDSLKSCGRSNIAISLFKEICTIKNVPPQVQQDMLSRILSTGGVTIE